MSPLDAFLLTAAIAVVAKTLAWLWQLRTRNAGMVDAVWAFTLGALAVVYAAAGTAPGPVPLLLALMGGLWGARLGLYLWRRNHGKPEDWRYAQLRRDWGARADAKMLAFFQFQNVFTLALAASAFLPVAYRTGAPGGAAIAAAVAIWLAAVAGEALADAQMARFRRNPANKGRVCREGFWNYSRHPNYFFECVHWLAYAPLALAGNTGSPAAWASLAAPAIMAFLLLKLSGVPLMEAEMAKRKRGYADYMRTTPVLIPGFPKQ